MAYNQSKPHLVWERNGELYVYTDHWIKLDILYSNELLNMAKAKLVWLKDGKLQTYTNHWEEISEPVPPTPVVHVTGVTLDQDSASLEPEETLQLTATVAPSDATDKRVTWTSSDNEVATVSSTGLVTAVADWEATITVKTKDWNHTATCAVAVSADVPVTAVALSSFDPQTPATIYTGRSTWSGIQVTPYTASDLHVTVTSSDSWVVQVGEITYDPEPTEWSVGYVSLTWVSTGTATVTITSQADPTISATYSFVVEQDVPVTSITKNGQYLTDVCDTNWMGAKIGEIKYTPSNAVAVGMDVGIRPKEWQKNIGRGWVIPDSSYSVLANVMFNVDSSVAQVWDSSTYEIFLNNDPTFTPLEFTVTVRQACTVTLATKNLTTGESGGGTVDPTSVIVPKGSIADTTSEGEEKLFFTPYLKAVATPYPSTQYAHFDFHQWDKSETSGWVIEGDCTITAEFAETPIPPANITFSPEDVSSQYVTISPTTMEVPDWSEVNYAGYDKITINGNSATVSLTSSRYSYPSYGRVAFTSYIPEAWTLNWNEINAWQTISGWNQNIVLGWWDEPITLMSSDGVDIQSDLDNNRPAFVLDTSRVWHVVIDWGCYVDVPPVFENVVVNISDGEISTEVDSITGNLNISVTTSPSDPTVTWTIEFDLIMPTEGVICYPDPLLVKHVVATLKYVQI